MFCHGGFWKGFAPLRQRCLGKGTKSCTMSSEQRVPYSSIHCATFPAHFTLKPWSYSVFVFTCSMLVAFSFLNLVNSTCCPSNISMHIDCSFLRYVTFIWIFVDLLSEHVNSHFLPSLLDADLFKWNWPPTNIYLCPATALSEQRVEIMYTFYIDWDVYIFLYIYLIFDVAHFLIVWKWFLVPIRKIRSTYLMHNCQSPSTCWQSLLCIDVKHQQPCTLVHEQLCIATATHS